MKITIFAILIFLLSGCTHLYMYHSYQSDELIIDSGKIVVHFSSAELKKVSELPEITEHNEPFGFRVVFVTNDEPGEEIQINVISASPSNTKWSVYKLNEVGITKQTYYKGKTPHPSGYSGLIKNVTNGHRPVDIELEIIYKGRTQRVKFHLEPEYREEHHNNWLDRVMSV